jgi:hypothetical protein
VVTPPKSKKVNFSENISLVSLILLSQVLKPAIDRVVAFFSSKEAVSQSVALETAAALQVGSSGFKNKIEMKINIENLVKLNKKLAKLVKSTLEK